jgi:hypothetical protein
MLAIGTELGGDARVIGLTHACRLAIVLTVLPQLLVHFGGVSPEVMRGGVGVVSGAAAAVAGGISLLDGALLVAAAAAGPLVGRVVHLTPGSQIGYIEHTGCHQLNRVLTVQSNVSEKWYPDP